MRLFYTDHFELPLPDGHRFPMDKYRRLRRRVAASDQHRENPLLVPPAATDDQLRLCHCHEYVARVAAGELSEKEIRRIGFPWSPKMVERSRRSTGATIEASRAALVEGVAANLAGGTHHAFADAGEGYCVFNDAGVAIRTMQTERRMERACVLDLDVHQGNGTAAIFADDPSVFTVSMHGVKNFPLRKMPSSLDVDLPDGTDDPAYLSRLLETLQILETEMSVRGEFDLVIYLAGADPYRDDRLGRLNLSKQGLRTRDETVFQWCKTWKIPVVITMAGGYSPDIDDIVDIHFGTLSAARQIFEQSC